MHDIEELQEQFSALQKSISGSGLNGADAPYIRVGVDFFKIIKKPDRYNIVRVLLKRWSKDMLILDYSKEFARSIPQYDDFIVVPDNINDNRKVGNCYNLYQPFMHEAVAPPLDYKYKGIYWTFVLMREIFGDQIRMGFQYMKALYEFPQKALPILALVSEERGTGKTTFLNWVNMVFGGNVANIEPDSITRQFNAEYVNSNIICIDEAVNDKQIAVEKIKSIATKKQILVSMKYVSPFEVNFYGKIIMASNNEKQFMRIDQKEIRFWVRKLNQFRIENHDIEDDLIKEIPYFLHYIKNLPNLEWGKSRMLFTPEQLSTESLNHVKEESQSTLHKDIQYLVDDWFDNNSEDILKLAPVDIKDAWFRNNHKIGHSYIKKVLTYEMRLEQSETVIRYQPLGRDSKTGRPYIFQRKSNKITKHDNKLPF